MRQSPWFLVILATTTLAGCSHGGAPATSGQDNPKVAGATKASRAELADSDQRQILDAVLRHALTDSELKEPRDFYGTKGDKKFALVSNPDGTSWPDWFRGEVEGYEVLRAGENTKIDPASPHLLGIRLDKYDLSDKADQLLDGQIRIVMFNAGGDGDDGAVIGGCNVFYDASREGDKWKVEYRGFLDP